MDLAGFDRLVADLDGVRASGPPPRRRWTRAGRLVARVVDERHVVLRVDLDLRHQLVADFPETFSVPRSMQRHTSVLVDLSGDPDAVQEALRAAHALHGPR